MLSPYSNYYSSPYMLSPAVMPDASSWSPASVLGYTGNVMANMYNIPNFWGHALANTMFPQAANPYGFYGTTRDTVSAGLHAGPHGIKKFFEFFTGGHKPGSHHFDQHMPAMPLRAFDMFTGHLDSTVSGMHVAAHNTHAFGHEMTREVVSAPSSFKSKLLRS